MKDWDQVLINASIAAMQGLQEGKFGVAADCTPKLLAKLSVKIGIAMTEELKKYFREQNS